jgi:hypothetical protein
MGGMANRLIQYSTKQHIPELDTANAFCKTAAHDYKNPAEWCCSNERSSPLKFDEAA